MQLVKQYFILVPPVEQEYNELIDQKVTVKGIYQPQIPVFVSLSKKCIILLEHRNHHFDS
jgi:hypothetical protein